VHIDTADPCMVPLMGHIVLTIYEVFWRLGNMAAAHKGALHKNLFAQPSIARVPRVLLDKER
jgi:hypothetical protein